MDETLETQLKGTMGNLERFMRDETKAREDLERKVNALKISGIAPAAKSAAADPEIEFKSAVKSWYPNRDEMLRGVDYKDYRAACSKYLRYGIDVLSSEERKAMSVGVDTEGGVLVTSELAREIIRLENDNSVIRGIARVLPAGSGDVEFPASLTRPEVGWVGERQQRDATDTPATGAKSFNVKELYCMPEVTQKIIDDSVFDIEAFLGEEIGIAIAEEEDQQFISGDGVLKPRGFTTYTTAAVADSAGTRAFGTIQHVATGQAGAWPTSNEGIYDLLVDVVHSLRPRYRRNARWVMPTAAVSKIRKLKDDAKNPIWQPSMAEGQPDRLLGYPVEEAEQMPAVGANSLSIGFADWRRAYWILDRLGVRVLRDPYTNKPYVRFYTTKRVAGGVADSAAIKLVKFAAA